MKKKLLLLINELIEHQQEKLLMMARKILPHVTHEDIMQPNDFPELELHPEFRYEEGILSGYVAMRSAIQSYLKEID